MRINLNNSGPHGMLRAPVGPHYASGQPPVKAEIDCTTIDGRSIDDRLTFRATSRPPSEGPYNWDFQTVL